MQATLNGGSSASQLIQPDASIASLSSLSAPLMSYAARSAPVNSGVRHASHEQEDQASCGATRNSEGRVE